MKIIIVDGHQRVRDRLRELLALLERGGGEVVGEAFSRRDAMTLAKEIQPDLILDVLVPTEDGADTTGIGPGSAKPLSPRERQVLQLIAEGHSSKHIATHLHVAVPTVETHRRQIMDKLQLRTIAQLTKYAIREGLTSTE